MKSETVAGGAVPCGRACLARAAHACFRIRIGLVLLPAAALAACGATTGIVPVGPGTYAVSEMRAQALGGGARAQQLVLAEAAGFCQQQGRSVALLGLEPGGDWRGYYWPTAFTATFRCGSPVPGQPPILTK